MVPATPLSTPIPRGKIAAFRKLLNAQDAANKERHADKEEGDITKLQTNHRHGRYRQVKRLYGDYLYFQDRDKFMADLRGWLQDGEPG